MMLKNLTRYYPEKMPYGDGVQYFIDENGIDFYDSFSHFTKRYKFCVEPETGVIRSYSEDISRLYPVGFDVVETDEIPDAFNIFGNFQFSDGLVIHRIVTMTEKMALAEKEKISLLADASNKISPLQDAVDLDIATEQEKSQLLAWKKYRVLLNRVDTSTAPDIAWPEPPAEI